MSRRCSSCCVSRSTSCPTKAAGQGSPCRQTDRTGYALTMVHSCRWKPAETACDLAGQQVCRQPCARRMDDRGESCSPACPCKIACCFKQGLQGRTNGTHCKQQVAWGSLCASRQATHETSCKTRRGGCYTDARGDSLSASLPVQPCKAGCSRCRPLQHQQQGGVSMGAPHKSVAEMRLTDIPRVQ